MKFLCGVLYQAVGVLKPDLPYPCLLLQVLVTMLSPSCCAEITLEGGYVETAYLKEFLYRKGAILVFSEGSDDLFFSLHTKLTICINIK